MTNVLVYHDHPEQLSQPFLPCIDLATASYCNKGNTKSLSLMDQFKKTKTYKKNQYWYHNMHQLITQNKKYCSMHHTSIASYLNIVTLQWQSTYNYNCKYNTEKT